MKALKEKLAEIEKHEEISKDPVIDVKLIAKTSESSTSDNAHSELANLGNDDHLQYLLTDGTRTQTSLEISGSITAGGSGNFNSLAVTNSATVGGFTQLNDDTTIAVGKKLLFAST